MQVARSDWFDRFMRRSWRFNIVVGLLWAGVVAGYNDSAAGKLAQGGAYVAASVVLWLGGCLCQTQQGGLDLPISEVTRWMWRLSLLIALFLYAMALMADEWRVEVLLGVIGGMNVFLAGMMRERLRGQFV